MSNPIVIDLSHWNPTPDWKTLAAGGTLGIIHKASEGISVVDDQYAGRRSGATAAGLFWSSYHFLKHGNVHNQMQHYVNVVQPQTGNRLCIDYEDPDCDLHDLLEAAAWLQDHTDCEVAVYGSSHLVDTLEDAANAGADLSLLDGTSLWQARYSSKQPVPPAPYETWSLWQYTDKANVQGIAQPVDGNKWNGDPDKLKDWFYNPKTTSPAGTAGVTVSITTSPQTGVRVIVNGTVVL